jgi:hypothetical protein
LRWHLGLCTKAFAVHICPLFVLSLNLQDRFLDPIVSLERPAVHLAHAANRRALTQDNLAIFYARAATNLEGRAHSAKEYRTCKNGLAIPFHQFVKRRPAGDIKGNNFSVQDCIFTLSSLAMQAAKSLNRRISFPRREANRYRPLPTCASARKPSCF